MKSFAAQGGPLNVHDFPRPPALEKCLRSVLVKLDGVVLADSNDAFWVLETTHPPTYYIPPNAIRMEHFTANTKSSFCEWKGRATYYDVSVNAVRAVSRAWSYDTPSPRFEAIRGYLAFYCGPFECFVNGEQVQPQPGDFYGGWMTSDIHGGKRGVKGGPGTSGW